jgi:hypothetical protein
MKVEYSNVTKTETEGGCDFGRGGYREGEVLTGTFEDKEELP